MPTNNEPITAEAPMPARKTKKVSLSLRCIFTDKELLEKGKLIAEKHRELAEHEGELATIKSQFKSKIEGVTASINELSGHITSGYEYRMTTCTVRFDDPKSGMKTTYRSDTGDAVNTDLMTPAELQGALPLNQRNDALPAKADRVLHHSDIKSMAAVDETGNVTVTADKSPI
jgi:hypothetical protein